MVNRGLNQYQNPLESNVNRFQKSWEIKWTLMKVKRGQRTFSLLNFFAPIPKGSFISPPYPCTRKKISIKKYKFTCASPCATRKKYKKGSRSRPHCFPLVCEWFSKWYFFKTRTSKPSRNCLWRKTKISFLVRFCAIHSHKAHNHKQKKLFHFTGKLEPAGIDPEVG